jgi:hypothetical protein
MGYQKIRLFILISKNVHMTLVKNAPQKSFSQKTILPIEKVLKNWPVANECRKLKSRYGARNRFQEPSLELSSKAT